MMRILVLVLLLASLALAGCQPQTGGSAPEPGASDPPPAPQPAEPAEPPASQPATAAPDPSAGPTAQTSPTLDRSLRLTQIPLEEPGKLPERVPVQETSEPLVSNVPGTIMMPILADLDARLGAGAGEITVIRAEAVTWGDGSLGCPQPGMFYTQSLVEGFWIVLKAGDQEYDYRASQGGYFFLCESGSPPGLPAGTPAS